MKYPRNGKWCSSPIVIQNRHMIMVSSLPGKYRFLLLYYFCMVYRGTTSLIKLVGGISLLFYFSGRESVKFVLILL